MQFSCIGPLRCFKMWLQSVGAAEIFQKRPDAKDKRHNEQQSDNEGIAKTAEMIANSGKPSPKIFIRAPFYSDMHIVPGQMRLKMLRQGFLAMGE